MGDKMRQVTKKDSSFKKFLFLFLNCALLFLTFICICHPSQGLDMPVFLNVTNESIILNINSSEYVFDKNISLHQLNYTFNCPQNLTNATINQTIYSCPYTLEDYGEVTYKQISSHEEWLKTNYLDDCYFTILGQKDELHQCQINLTTNYVEKVAWETKISKCEDEKKSQGEDIIALMIALGVIAVMLCIFFYSMFSRSKFRQPAPFKK